MFRLIQNVESYRCWKYSQPCLSRICWDWRNSFDFNRENSTYEGLKTIEYKEKRTWIDLRLGRLFDLCEFDLGKVDCILFLWGQTVQVQKIKNKNNTTVVSSQNTNTCTTKSKSILRVNRTQLHSELNL